MENNSRQPGWGARMPGWQDESDTESEGQELEPWISDGDAMEEEFPEIVEQVESWKELNTNRENSSSSDDEGPAPKRRRSDHEKSRKQKRRKQKEERREARRERRERRERRKGRETAVQTKPNSRNEANTISSLWKSWAMPKLRDEITHDEMRLEWPIWRDMLVSALELQSPSDRKWSEEEMFMTLMMHGGRNIRETASFTAPVSGEVLVGEDGKEPKFSNLITRCNVTYRARDPTMEITVLRNMMQKKDESVREFLEKARRQISLCGYNTGAERDRELVMLLKQNTLDAISISKHGIGQNLEQMEALALNLEAIRQREQRQAVDSEEKRMKQEIDIHAVMEKFNKWSEANQPRTSSYQQRQTKSRDRSDCNRCGRKGGHEEGWKCRAVTMECFKCGRPGHLAAVCRQANVNVKNEPASGGKRGQREQRERDRVNQVSTRGSQRNTKADGWDEDWEG